MLINVSQSKFDFWKNTYINRHIITRHNCQSEQKWLAQTGILSFWSQLPIFKVTWLHHGCDSTANKIWRTDTDLVKYQNQSYRISKELFQTTKQQIRLLDDILSWCHTHTHTHTFVAGKTAGMILNEKYKILTFVKLGYVFFFFFMRNGLKDHLNGRQLIFLIRNDRSTNCFSCAGPAG